MIPNLIFNLRAKLAQFLFDHGLAWDSTIDYERRRVWWTWYCKGKKQAQRQAQFQDFLHKKEEETCQYKK